jgi:hypothetical protein
MADLAGFDVIVELHRDTGVAFINMVPTPTPAGGDIRLLGGRFSADLSVNVPQVGTTAVNSILEVTLEPVVHQRRRACDSVVRPHREAKLGWPADRCQADFRERPRRSVAPAMKVGFGALCDQSRTGTTRGQFAENSTRPPSSARPR